MGKKSEMGVEKFREGVGGRYKAEVRPSYFSVDWHICHPDCAPSKLGQGEREECIVHPSVILTSMNSE